MAYSLGIPDLGGMAYLQAALAGNQLAQRDRELAARSSEVSAEGARRAQELAQNDAYRRAALGEQARQTDATSARADAELGLQQQTEARRAGEADNLGNAIDLGAGYRGVVTGPHSLSVIAPQEKPFVPDAATMKSLQQAGYLYAPQSEKGGSFVPIKTGVSASPTFIDARKLGLGNGYEGIIQDAKGGVHVLRSPADKPLDSTTSFLLGGIDDSIAGLTKRIATLSGLPADKKIELDPAGNPVTPWFGGTPVTDHLKQAQADLMEQQMKRDSLLNRAGRTRPDAPAAPAASPSPSAAAAPVDPMSHVGTVPFDAAKYTNPPGVGATPAPVTTLVPSATPPPAPVATPAPAAAAPTSDAAAAIAAARAAIARGADRAQVIARLQQNGYDPSGL